eukprot:3934922-Rhodomonas_salina.1
MELGRRIVVLDCVLQLSTHVLEHSSGHTEHLAEVHISPVVDHVQESCIRTLSSLVRSWTRRDSLDKVDQ